MAKRIVFSPVTEEQWRAAHEKSGSVYFIRDADNDRMKIGHSRDPWSRLKQLQTGSSSRLSLVAVIAGSEAIEEKMHYDMGDYNVHGEWFLSASQCIADLNRLTNNSLMCRLQARMVPAREVQVHWQWDAEHSIHFKHVYDDDLKQWVGPLMYSGKAGARRGWSATVMELAAV